MEITETVAGKAISKGKGPKGRSGKKERRKTRKKGKNSGGLTRKVTTDRGNTQY